jgi:hypothetical protein
MIPHNFPFVHFTGYIKNLKNFLIKHVSVRQKYLNIKLKKIRKTIIKNKTKINKKMILIRKLYDFLQEVQKVTGKIPSKWIKLEPLVHEVTADTLAAGATLTMEKWADVNEAFVIPFWYGAVDGTKGKFNVDVNIAGPVNLKFDSLILSMENDKPVTNPAIVVGSNESYRVTITNNTKETVNNVILQAWGFRMEKEAFKELK